MTAGQDWLRNLSIGQSSKSASALFSVAGSTSQGSVVAPSMTTAQRTSISSPATSLVVYDTDLLRYYFYNGTSWIPMAAVTANLSVRTETTTYLATLSDDMILGSTSGGGWSLSLPTAVGNSGKTFYLKKITSDANAWTIDPNSTETIDGQPTYVIYAQYDAITITSDGSNWVISSFLFNRNILAVTSAQFPLTTSGYATGEWAQLSSNSTSVPPGRWRATGTLRIIDVGTNGTYTALQGLYGSANGNNTTSAPALFSVAAGVTLVGGRESTLLEVTYGGGGNQVEMPSVIYNTTQTQTIYLNMAVNFSSAGQLEMQTLLLLEKLP